MPGEITGEEGNSECCDNLTSEATFETLAPRSDAKRPREISDLGLKYISNSYVLKKIIIAAAILVIALIIVIILLAVRKTRTCPSCHFLASQSVACPDSWIGYSGKCFYVSKEERNWSLSLTTCSSFNASLAVIDSQKELDFWIGIFQRIHFWFGLSKENKIWKWSNGTEFKNHLNPDIIFVTQKSWKMPGITDDDSGYWDPSTAKLKTTSSSESPDAESPCKAVKNKVIICKAQKLALTIVTVAVIITTLIVTCSLAVYNLNPCLSCVSTVSGACPDFWIGYRRKCFYVSKEERNWSLSLKTCSSLNSSLAVIDTEKELDFWVEIFHPLHYWFGLSREINVWKWYNGTEFKNQFEVRGEGFCAYVDGKGASSTICSMEKRFLCSRPESCSKPG